MGPQDTGDVTMKFARHEFSTEFAGTSANRPLRRLSEAQARPWDALGSFTIENALDEVVGARRIEGRGGESSPTQMSSRMTAPSLFLIATALLGAAIISEALTRVSEVPEIASMALLSLVLPGVSVMVRRTGTQSDDRGRHASGTTPRL